MADAREAVKDLLAEKPELKSALRDILRADEEGTWEFQDVDVDSGAFGEIVSRGIAEQDGDGYRLADAGAVRSALDGDGHAGSDGDGDSSDAGSTPGIADATAVDLARFRPSVTRSTLLAVGGAVGLLVCLRVVFAYPSVFRNGDVVLLGNDPYAYRYQVEQLLGSDLRAFDPGSLGRLPENGLTNDTLFVVVLWWLAALFGGTADVAGPVLAWFPVEIAAVTGVLVYLATAGVTDDRRVGLAAVLVLAVTPVHAYRTAVGFVDHHGFDYFWLALTLYALVRIEGRDGPSLSLPDREFGDARTWLFAGVLGVALAGQILSWRGAPLLLFPLVPYVALVAVSDARAAVPVVERAPLVAGLGLAGVLTLAAHLLFGWLPVYRAYAPALLFLGAVGVFAIALGARRLDLSAPALAAVEGLFGALALGMAVAVVPAFDTALSTFLAFLTQSPGIAETVPLFSGQLGTVIGPFFIFGATLFLAAPVVAWATLRTYRTHEPAWLALVVYAWFLFALTVVQIRFGGALAVVLSVFGGLTFVYLAAIVDLTDRPAPFVKTAAQAGGRPADGDRTMDAGATGTGPTVGLRLDGLDTRTVSLFVVLFLLVGGIGLLQTPVKTGQLTYDGDQYRTATWIEAHAAEQGLTYPENYVLSRWGANRMYNYFVSGQSESYTFAERNYEAALTSTTPEAVYERLGDRTGYLVLGSGATGFSPDSLYIRLFEGFGSATGDVSGVEHYRALYAASDGSPKAFSLVPGATVVGTIGASENATVEKNVEIPGASFTYERRVRAGETGWYAVTVPYEGTYDIGGDRTTVSPADVQEGGFMADQNDRAHWSFDAGHGDVAFDRDGGNHGWVRGASWTERGINGSALRFAGEGAVTVPNSSHLGESDAVTVSAWFKTDPDVNYTRTHELRYAGLVSKRPGGNYGETDGYFLFLSRGRIAAILGDGNATTVVRGPEVTDSEWHHVAMVWNGNELVLYLDGTVVDHDSYRGEINTDALVRIGTSAENGNNFQGDVDDVIIIPTAMNATDVQRQSTRATDD